MHGRGGVSFCPLATLPHHGVFPKESHFGPPGGRGVGPQMCQASPGAAAACQGPCLSREEGPASGSAMPDPTFLQSASPESAAGAWPVAPSPVEKPPAGLTSWAFVSSSGNTLPGPCH